MFSITCISSDQDGISTFSKTLFPKSERSGMHLSEQIGTINFRIRESEVGYQSSWHMAGDPTLIIINQGVLRITLQDGSYKDFTQGEMFIAADNLPASIIFDEKIHGHRAEVIGETNLKAIHIKLKDFLI